VTTTCRSSREHWRRQAWRRCRALTRCAGLASASSARRGAFRSTGWDAPLRAHPKLTHRLRPIASQVAIALPSRTNHSYSQQALGKSPGAVSWLLATKDRNLNGFRSFFLEPSLPAARRTGPFRERGDFGYRRPATAWATMSATAATKKPLCQVEARASRDRIAGTMQRPEASSSANASQPNAYDSGWAPEA